MKRGSHGRPGRMAKRDQTAGRSITMKENVWSHFGTWWAVVLWVVLFGVFLAFIPFYQKSQRKPASVYLAFILALALEMFGVPLSMYMLTGVLGRALPEGVLWGHTLS